MGVGWCLSGLAGVAALHNESEQAVKLWAVAEALRESIGARPAPAARATRERLMASMQKQLGKKKFAELWKRGTELRMPEAIASALASSESIREAGPPSQKQL